MNNLHPVHDAEVKPSWIDEMVMVAESLNPTVVLHAPLLKNMLQHAPEQRFGASELQSTSASERGSEFAFEVDANE